MLQQVEIFQGLTEEELEALLGSSTSRSFPKNTVVIHENDPADSLLFSSPPKIDGTISGSAFMKSCATSGSRTS